MRLPALLLVVTLVGCGGAERAPRLAWSAPAVTPPTTATLTVEPGEGLPTPAGDWFACLAVSGPVAASPPCVTFRDCDRGGCAAAVQVSRTGAGPASITATGPSGVAPSGPLAVAP